jgi:hypothetical protein
MVRPRAADDFPAIRARLEERERRAMAGAEDTRSADRPTGNAGLGSADRLSSEHRPPAAAIVRKIWRSC